MNERRLMLHDILCELLGSSEVYFQPPTSTKMRYPAIVYSLNNIDSDFADDKPYVINRQYAVTLIDKNPDNDFIDKLAALPSCKFVRHYTKDNLNHYLYTLYF